MRIALTLGLGLVVVAQPLSAQVSNRIQSATPFSVAAGSAPMDVAVDLSFGTLGFGVDVSKLVRPHIGLRVGASYYSLSKTTTQSDVDYDATIKLGAFSALADWFPKARGAFHLTGGLMSIRTKMDGTGDCSGGTIELNDNSYSCAQVGTLTMALKFPSASPYLGLGFGTPAKGSRIHFVMNLGAAIGKPDLTLTSSNSGSNAALASDVRAQQDKTQKDIEKFAKVYPVIQTGLGFRF